MDRTEVRWTPEKLKLFSKELEKAIGDGKSEFFFEDLPYEVSKSKYLVEMLKASFARQ